MLPGLQDILASAGLFCWKSTDKIVIVDIDGTITRTDVGGVSAITMMLMEMIVVLVLVTMKMKSEEKKV